MANSLQRPDFSVPKTAVVESFGCSSCRKRWKVLPYAFVKIINMNVLFWKSIVQSVHFETPISVKKNPKSLQKKHKISSESDRKWREEHWWPLAEEDWKCKVSDNYLEVISKSGSHIYLFITISIFFMSHNPVKNSPASSGWADVGKVRMDLKWKAVLWSTEHGVRFCC